MTSTAKQLYYQNNRDKILAQKRAKYAEKVASGGAKPAVIHPIRVIPLTRLIAKLAQVASGQSIFSGKATRDEVWKSCAKCPLVECNEKSRRCVLSLKVNDLRRPQNAEQRAASKIARRARYVETRA